MDQDLMYVSYGGSLAGSSPSVGVYTFPSGHLVGTWTGTSNSFTSAECADNAGNVFVSYSAYLPGTGGWVGEILKFARGETSPAATLKDPSAFPIACSVDPISGDLAVVNSGGADTLLVYPSGSQSPVVYTDSGVNLYGVTYDDKGNIFVDGLAGQKFSFAELPSGGMSLEQITFKTTFAPGELQWDGRYVTLGESAIISRLAIDGNSGKLVGSTPLTDFVGDSVVQYWIAGNQVLVAWFRRPVGCPPEGCGPPDGPVGRWSYPSGKVVRKSITGSFSAPSGVTLSVKPSR